MRRDRLLEIWKENAMKIPMLVAILVVVMLIGISLIFTVL
jgi:hypothetical protein